MKFSISIIFFLFCRIILKAQVITTIAGNNTLGYSGDGGPALNAQIGTPYFLTVDAVGNIYFYQDFRIRKIDTAGIVSVFAGTGVQGYSGDGGPALLAQFSTAGQIAIDANGNIYYADGAKLRKINSLGIISTIAGNGTSGYSGDGGPALAAQVSVSSGLTFDNYGNIFFANDGSTIRKIDTLGVITTVAGTGVSGFSGDGGPAVYASFNYIYCLVIDNNGDIIVGEYGRIRKINSNGIISTIAGNGTYAYAGDGGLAVNATFEGMNSITQDQFGNLYVNDSHRVRMINSANGIINTVVGTGQPGYSGDGAAAVLAQLNNPYCIFYAPDQNLYIADASNYVIRKVGNCVPLIPKICQVSVDSLSQNNLIYWDKNEYPNAAYFNVYRDTSNNNFAIIGSVSSNSPSLFVDTLRQLYTANGNPNITNWRYKIAYYDSCSNSLSPFSPWHQSIYLYNLGGLFVWNHYQIEGQATPITGLSNYLLKRDNGGNSGNWIIAATASASSNNINDPQYNNYQNSANWRLETQWNTNCSSNGEVINTSISNATLTTLGLNTQSIMPQKINIYPNPNEGIFTVSSKSIEGGRLQIINVLGEVILTQEIKNTQEIIDLSGRSKGIYFINYSCGSNSIYKTNYEKFILK